MEKIYFKKLTLLMFSLILVMGVRADLKVSDSSVIEGTKNQNNEPKVSLKASKSELLETESVEIVATLSSPATKKVVIDLGFSGTATFDRDYLVDFSTKGPKTVAGGQGEGGNADQVNYPTAVAIDRNGNLFVSDNSGKITKWSPGSTVGDSVRQHWNRAKDLHADKEGNLYVLEEWSSRVMKFSPGVLEGVVVAGSPLGQRGNNANELNQPSGMFIDEEGNIFIADRNNHRIQKWAPNATEGETVAGGNGQGSANNQLNDPTGVSVDQYGNIYVLDNGNGRIQKWVKNEQVGSHLFGGTVNDWVGSSQDFKMDLEGNFYVLNYSSIIKYEKGTYTPTTIAGQGGYGAGINQFNNPQKFQLDSWGNLYVADSHNHRVQKYQNSPQIIIPIGETSGKVKINGIKDDSYEDDESIIIAINKIVNASYDGDKINLLLKDTDEAPTVTYNLSNDRISENSDEPLVITAKPSKIAGKEISIYFELGGDASSEKYKISSMVLIIPANTSSGSISISTAGVKSDQVDILRSIELSISNVVNATTETDNLKVYLVNENKPSYTLQLSKDIIAEHETTTITGHLSAATSRDVLIDLNLSGSAILDRNFELKFDSKGPKTVAGGNGMGNNLNQVNSPIAVTCDSEGNVYVSTQNGEIIKWNKGALEGEHIFHSGGRVRALHVDDGGYLYILQEWNSNVIKYDLKSGNQTVVAGNGNAGTAHENLNYPRGMFVDKHGNIYISDTHNHRVQKWTKGAGKGITVAGGNGAGNQQNQLNFPTALYVNEKGDIFITDQSNNRIQKWKAGSTTGETFISNITPVFYANVNHITFDNNGGFYVLEDNLIKKYHPGQVSANIVAGQINRGSAADQLSNATGLYVDKDGNIFIADSGNHRVQKYQNSPQILIRAGETSGKVIIQGIDDDVNDKDKVLNISINSSLNAKPENQQELIVTILDNTKTLTLKNNPFIGLSKGAVAWGDFDNDGDMDVAVMGQSPTAGAVTRLYENVNGNFVNTNQDFSRLFDGDISWVDINKDGWIDLVISGYNNGPQTKVYLNNGDKTFKPTDDYGLPQLFSSKMAWGDLDNDGDIDLAISGIDASDNYVFQVYYKIDTSERFERELEFHYEGFIKGDLKIVDIDLDGDNDIIYSGESKSGYPVGQIITNSYIKTGYYSQSMNILGLKNSTVLVDNIYGNNRNRLTIIAMGQDSNGSFKLSSTDQLQIKGTNTSLPNLINGDMAIGDFNNDGLYDIVFTGEDEKGNPISKLFIQKNSPIETSYFNYIYFEESDIELIGLRESTVTWVDYDMDGDLDLFMTGIDAQGVARSILYESEVRNKKNTAPMLATNLKVVDLGNGKMRFSWDAPNDDFSKNLGYILRLGTTPGGTELSNTESNLATGMRQISKPAPIYSTSFETQLDPGQYYWAIQGVDTGLMGGEFSEESSLTLTYDWKIMNQGGIVDRSIQGKGGAILKLADLNNNNFLDLIYGSNVNNYMGWGGNVEVFKFDGKRLVRNTKNQFWGSNIIDVEVGDINGDGVSDVLISSSENNNFIFRLYVSNKNDTTGYQMFQEQGLHRAKARFVDLNNDGKSNIVLAGLSSSTTAGSPRLWVYDYQGTGLTKTDLSSKIASLKFSSFDFGDFDNDQDIDFVITGFNDMEGLQSFLYENSTELGGEFQLNATSNNIAAIRDGTINFIDFDGDGDLDLVVSGAGEAGDIFEIYVNKLNEGSTTWPRINMGLVPVRNGKIDLGDFNGDGYADLLYSGLSQGEGKITKLAEFDPISQSYKDSNFDVSDIIDASVEFGDLDGDGDLDFVISGESREDNGQYIFRAYLNVRNESAKVMEQVSGGANARVANSTDLSSSSSYVINRAPSVPITKETKLVENIKIGQGTHAVEFSWNASDDDFTPDAGLTYALKVGTTPGGEEIMSSNANISGNRKSAGKGNVEHNLKWKLSLKPGTYYWSVQSIDAAYLGSAFSAPRSFTVNSTGVKQGPVIENQEFFIEEFAANGAKIGKVTARHPENINFTYKILSGNIDNTFEVNETTGEITVKNSAGLDLSKRERFVLNIQVQDINGGKSQADINIKVLKNYGEGAIIIHLDGDGVALLTADQFLSEIPANNTVTISKSEFGCNDVKDHLIVISIRDQNGKETKSERKVTVVDNILPTVKARNLQLTLNDSGEALITVADVDDGSFDNCDIVSQTLSKTKFTLKDAGDNKVIYSVTDASGNTSSKEISVSVDVILSAGQNREVESIKLFPNPVQREVNIEFSNPIGPDLKGIQVTDAQGRIMNDIKVQEWEGRSISFDVSMLSSGTYFVRLNYNNKVQVMRFVKTH